VSTPAGEQAFLQAMRWVEEEHDFPAELAQFHSQRFQQLVRLSNMTDGLPPLVVVAGSCGKASTARFLAFMLRAAGYRVGLGSKPPLSESPHGHRERYQLVDAEGEHWIAPELFTRLCEPLPELVRQLPARLGAVAPYDLRSWILLRAFQEWKVDFGIVEANIGLREDPAGALPAQLTVITPIAADHETLLRPPPDCVEEARRFGRAAGPLWHKLSRVPSQRVVVGPQRHISPGELDRLLNRPGPRFGRDFSVDQVRSDREGGFGRFSGPEGELPLQLECLGDFQLENAATAAMASSELIGYRPESILQGARACQFRGRMEVLSRQPLTLLAAFGTLAKVQAMLDSLEPLLDTPKGDGVVVVMTVLERTANQGEAVRYLAGHPRLSALVATRYDYPQHDAQDLPAEQVAELARQARPDLPVLVCPDPGQAVQQARGMVGPGGVLVLLGSGISAYSGQSRLDATVP
jgi:dihydrofolate synthase/folylpolyglutamate synthase